MFTSGIKFSMSDGTDVSEANMLSYKDSYIQVYSNSWGPSDYGFVVKGPDVLARHTLETATAQVIIYLGMAFKLQWNLSIHCKKWRVMITP